MSISGANSAYASIPRAQAAISSLSNVLGQAFPDFLTYSETPASDLLQDPDVYAAVTARLRHPRSGVGDDNLCRWLYDTFQSMDPDLQLTVLHFVPVISGVYLCRAVKRKPLPGFEAVLLALYAQETAARGDQPLSVTIPNVADHPSLYHETPKSPAKNKAAELHMAVLSPVLKPHRTVRASTRARVVGVALEMYFSKIALMSVSSKIDFCEFCSAWASGRRREDSEGSSAGSQATSADEESEKGVRIPLPWELLQPALRILSHCLMGPAESDELQMKVVEALRSVNARAVKDLIPQAILATRSLLRLWEMETSSTRAIPESTCAVDIRELEQLAMNFNLNY